MLDNPLVLGASEFGNSEAHDSNDLIWLWIRNVGGRSPASSEQC